MSSRCEMLNPGRTKEYSAILGRYDRGFAQAARDAYAAVCADARDGEDRIICRTGAYVAGPALYSFVWWVLNSARQNGIDRLYFLARDGYVMYRIARLICEKRSLGMQCHYLRCSRLSLRKAAYCLPDCGALDHLFEGGYSVTYQALVARSGLGEERFRQLVGKPVPGWVGSKHRLTNAELKEIKKQMMGNQGFVDAICLHSRDDLQNCLAYLGLMGLLNNKAFGIVDTGWTGSMQKMLYHILNSTGKEPEIDGFYFGLFNAPAPGTGSYHSWYLSPRAAPGVIGRFNNNVIECFCGNDTPMTIGYELNEEGAFPVYAQASPLPGAWNVSLQRESIVSFAREAIDAENGKPPDPDHCLRLCRKLLGLFISRPDREEAAVYGRFSFCDDMSENRLSSLAVVLDREMLKEYHVLPRVFRALRAKGGENTLKEPVYWAYGSLAISPAIANKRFYRVRIFWLNVLFHWKNSLVRRR